MSNVENISKIYLLSVPLENDYKHTLYFNDKSAQESYFAGLPAKAFTDFSYQRKDSTIRVPLPYDQTLKYNYVRYQNSYYSNKWFYAFITKHEYINEDVTLIHIQTDVMQTWLKEYNVLQSFVEREHVSDDTIGKHTIPENLELGEYYCHTRYENDTFDNLSLVIGVTQESDGSTWFDSYDGIPSGIIYYAFDINDTLDDKVVEFLERFKSRLEAIFCMFIYPTSLLQTYSADSESSTGAIVHAHRVKPSNYPRFHEFLISKDDCFKFGDFNGANVNYKMDKPKNNKLFTYPYMYLLASNNNGGSAIYQYEHFTEDQLYFQINGCITPGGSIRMIPAYYKGASYNNEEGLNLGKFAICSWAGDVFTNWLTQNSINVGVNTAVGLFQIIGGIIATVGSSGFGAVLGGSMIAGGVAQIGGTMGEIQKAYLTPPHAQGNVNAGDVITASGRNKFTFYNMRIKPEYMKIIDDYFTMFGYKVNDLKIPNENHRTNYWFTKTIDVNISGDIPKEDLEVIKSSYNNGITFWKNPANIKNYSVDNKIT